MDINIARLEGQLTEIVQSHNTTATASRPEPVKIEPVPNQNLELARLIEARDAGVEAEYLSVQTDQMNRFVKELDLDIKFKVNISDDGYYTVQVLDDKGEVVKTIPGEAFVETRERIKTQVKGLLEDSHN